MKSNLYRIISTITTISSVVIASWMSKSNYLVLTFEEATGKMISIPPILIFFYVWIVLCIIINIFILIKENQWLKYLIIFQFGFNILWISQIITNGKVATLLLTPLLIILRKPMFYLIDIIFK